jgi:hypothetical protein
MGQPGVDALIAANADARLVDSVCRQRDCKWSRLYWHTDLEQAKRVARQTGKPILSLRLLGNLDEELSCANSRYFRTLLYSNRQISAYLRANYVLHWKSERPAPVMTVDFGGGRRMQRTVTGNSIHYILDAEGRPLDAIPGLYSAPAFLSLLREGAELHDAVARAENEGKRDEALRNYHRNAYYASRPRRRLGLSPLAPANDHGDAREQRLGAWTAASVTTSKSDSESAVLDKVSLDARALGWRDELLKLIAETVVGAATIDDNSRALIRAKRASAPLSQGSFDAMLKRLEKSIAADTKLNQEKLHPQIHYWLSDGQYELENLNSRVYEELFYTPGNDPWMGLVSDVSFTGIEGEGLFSR